MSTITLLVINPNSSNSVTNGLKQVLQPPPGVALEYYTAPKNAPDSIMDITTGVLSATAVFKDLKSNDKINPFDGFLVCCFSDHPLTHMLRENSGKPVINILEAAITHSLLIGQRFGIITTGTGYKYIYHTDVRNFFGATSERFAGLVTTGLGVVELREGDPMYVAKQVKKGAAQIAEKGADVIILGCAGMAGMENIVKQGVEEAGFPPVRIADGAKAGLQILAGLARLAT
ncbi:Asp/Glu/hydantoin racemase [Crepidotus variabilis]|uniref:Asp/Glu/hydantoin racemase n=1 Tax=Crepidotus variabilis TaxID=179855 RepID=A0A9P6E6V4_9AGAR|nr:Asp/Glu/hydantoin racemase [Crepidotus variabilis]